MNQGYPLSIAAYGLGILPIIREFQKSHPGVTQPWYTDDAGAGGTFKGIRRHLDDLMSRAPPQGYFTKPTKSILVVSTLNVLQAGAFFWSYSLQIVTGSRYLREFVGTKAAQDL